MTCIYLHTHILHFTLVSIVTEEIVKLEVFREDIPAHNFNVSKLNCLPRMPITIHRLNICGMQRTSYYIGYLHVIIRLTHANVWESTGKPYSCTQLIKSRIFYSKSRENPYQYCKSRENPYQVLQVTCAASERALKSVAGKFAYTEVTHNTKQKALFLFFVMCIVRGNR